MAPVLLVARRDYFAYVGAWGFWLSLLTAPLLLAMWMFGPMLLAGSEPSRTLAIVADRPQDAAAVETAFAERARRAAREEVALYVQAAAPGRRQAALAAFDAAPTREAAIAAARAAVAAGAPQAAAAMPQPAPRYRIVSPPAATVAAMRPWLDGSRTLDGGAVLFGALNIRRDGAEPVIEYWSANRSLDEPSDVAQRAMRLAMQREALAAHGIDPGEADRLNAFSPRVVQFDARPQAAGGEVTLRERAPAFAALALAFMLWSVVFSVANMLLSGVVEEKSNKILDTLLTSVSPLELLAGKLMGVAAVSATLLLLWGALGGVFMSAAAARMGDSTLGQIAAAFLDPRLIVAFAVGFVAGYLMYGAIFLALGSLCESTQEAHTLLGPVMLILAVPMLLVMPALDNPNAPIVAAASWVPLFTPFLMLMRAPAGLSWVEIAGQGAAMLAAIALILLLASQVFRAGVVNQLSLSSLFGRRGRH